MDKPITLDTDEAAARFVENISGWVSRDGRFFGKDEQTARYAGATHLACKDCGTPTPKGYLVCDTCREKRDIARYLAKEKRPWTGAELAYSEAADRYFADMDEMMDYCEEEERSPASLRLVLCEPVYAREVETDYWGDETVEDEELPDELLNALETLNAYLREEKIGLSWTPGKYAVKLEEKTP